MKKLLFALACVVSLSTLATPQAMAQTAKTKIKTTTVTGVKTTPASAPAATGLAEYVGKYKFEGLPFEYLTVTLKDGKLLSSNGEEPTALTPLKEADNFDSAGRATLIFTRGADKKIKGVTIDAQGMQFEGTKEAK